MTRNRRWYVQLVFGFLAMLASMGLVDQYITPADAATPTKEQVPGRMEQEQPDFWVGIHCYAPVPPVLRAHIKIPEGQGLLVVDVVDEGPGKKGDIRNNDILISIGPTPLCNVNDLIQAVEAAGGKPIKLWLLRAGKPVSLTIKPEKRPEEMCRPSLPAIPNTPDMELIQRLFEQSQPGQGYKSPMRLRFFHSGTILPSDALTHPGLPSGLTISITRTGKEPAEIVANRYNAKTKKRQTWKVTEKDLNPLPDDIRPHVERMLSGVIVGSMPQFDFMPSFGSNHPRPLSAKARNALRQQIQEMQEQINRMNQKMDQTK